MLGPTTPSTPPIGVNLGVNTLSHGADTVSAGEHIPADATGRTEVVGVWAAGNVTDLMAQVCSAAAAGAFAAAQINTDLVVEETSQAVETYRDVPSAPF